jgi:hypothetical protein
MVVAEAQRGHPATPHSSVGTEARMDGSQFDTLARAFATTGTRRWLVRLVAALPLGGALSTLGQDEAVAERPHERLARRTPQRNRKQRTQRQQNQNQNTNDGGGGNGGGGGGNGGGGGGNGGGGNDNTNNNRNDNTLGSGAPCGTGPACTSGQVCLSGDCFTTCRGPFNCLGGSGGCPQSWAACQQTTSGTAVCITLTTSDSCTTDADCGLGAVCITNPPDPSCQGNLPRYCANNA